jgi:hypothetical protein
VSRAQQVGCSGAAALARSLVRDLGQLVADGSPLAVDRLRTAVSGIDYALGVGLGFDRAIDPEVTYRRGLGRHLALVLRHTGEAARSR